MARPDNTQQAKDLKHLSAGYNKFLKNDTPKRIISAAVVKRLIQSMDLRSSSDFADAVAKEVCGMIAKAARRCYNNNRGTVRPTDL